jgi:hypothetical protein
MVFKSLTMKNFFLATFFIIYLWPAPSRADSGIRNPGLFIGSVPVLLMTIGLITTAFLQKDSTAIQSNAQKERNTAEIPPPYELLRKKNHTTLPLKTQSLLRNANNFNPNSFALVSDSVFR